MNKCVNCGHLTDYTKKCSICYSPDLEKYSESDQIVIGKNESSKPYYGKTQTREFDRKVKLVLGDPRFIGNLEKAQEIVKETNQPKFKAVFFG